MPELPEVETVMRGLEKRLGKAQLKDVVLRRQKIRTPIPSDFVQKTKGHKIKAYERRAKYIWLHLDNAQTIIIHLGMSGRLTVQGLNYEPDKHDHVLFYTARAVVVFNDYRRFGVVTVVETAHLKTHPLFRHLGVEPFSKEYQFAYFYKELLKRKCAIKLALLDQKLVVGVGNIYASEALFYAKVHPSRRACDVHKAEAQKIFKMIPKILQASIDHGGSSLKDYVDTDGALGFFQDQFAVYDRAGLPCPKCTCNLAKTGGIIKINQGGRSTYYCREKQL